MCGILGQEDHEFEMNMGYTARLAKKGMGERGGKRKGP